MFCGKCGTNVDGLAYCPRCGNPVAQPVVAQQNNVEKKQQQPKNNKALITGVVAVVLAAIIVLGIVFIPAAVNTPEKVAEKYAYAYVEREFLEADKCLVFDLNAATEEMYEKMCEEDDCELDDLFNDVEEYIEEDDYTPDSINSFSDLYEELKDYTEYVYEEEYGYDYIIEVKAFDTDKISDSELEEEIEDFKSDLELFDLSPNDYFDADKIKDARIVEVKMSVEGVIDEDEDTQEFVLVKYKGMWRVLDAQLLYMLY